MSTDCCTYGCRQAPNCPAGSVVAEKLLAGEKLPELVPLYNEPPEDEREDDADELLAPLEMLSYMALFLAVCVAGFLRGFIFTVES